MTGVAPLAAWPLTVSAPPAGAVVSSTTLKLALFVRVALFCVETDLVPGSPAPGPEYEYVRVVPLPLADQPMPMAAAVGKVVLAMSLSASATVAVRSKPPLAASLFM